MQSSRCLSDVGYFVGDSFVVLACGCDCVAVCIGGPRGTGRLEGWLSVPPFLGSDYEKRKR